jgi:hypothetical protein
VINLISGALHGNTLEGLRAANRKGGESKARRAQRASADRLRQVGRAYQRERFGRVVLLIDNAPGTGARRSTRRWRKARTWSSSGRPATARSSTRSSGPGRRREDAGRFVHAYRVARGGTEPDTSVSAGPATTLFRGGGKDNRRQPPPRHFLNSPLSHRVRR